MNNLYDKIYEAVNSDIQKALIISDDQSGDSSVKFHNKEISTEFIPYEYRTVNLGLPSGLLWCEYNLGAYPGNKAEDWYGNYYAWGEIKPKSDYSWETYKHCNGTDHSLIKYNADIMYGKTDNKIQLESDDDAARQILGDKFRMPTKKEFDELLNNTTNEWIENYKHIHGLNGRLFTSKNNGDTLFLPAAGFFSDTNLIYVGTDCSMWSASIKPTNSYVVYYLTFLSGYISITDDIRRYGFSVHAVQDLSIK